MKKVTQARTDLENMGDAAAGASTAALHLAEFAGDIPWTHLDLCGPMKVDADESWRPKGPPVSARSCWRN